MSTDFFHGGKALIQVPLFACMGQGPHLLSAWGGFRAKEPPHAVTQGCCTHPLIGQVR